MGHVVQELEAVGELAERGRAQHDVEPRSHSLIRQAGTLTEQFASCCGVRQSQDGGGPGVGQPSLHDVKLEGCGVELLDERVQAAVQGGQLGLGGVEVLLGRPGGGDTHRHDRERKCGQHGRQEPRRGPAPGFGDRPSHENGLP